MLHIVTEPEVNCFCTSNCDRFREVFAELLVVKMSSSVTFQFSGKSVLVTGAAGGMQYIHLLCSCPIGHIMHFASLSVCPSVSCNLLEKPTLM